MISLTKNYKKISLMIGIGIFLVLSTAICVLSVLIIMSKVNIPKSALPLVRPANLLLTTHDLPSNWRIDTTLLENAPEGGIYAEAVDVATRTYTLMSTTSEAPFLISHSISRHTSIDFAKITRGRITTGYDDDDQPYIYNGSIADDTIYKCNIEIEGSGRFFICDFVARYGKYVSWLRVYQREAELSNEDLDTILSLLEEKFVGIENND